MDQEQDEFVSLSDIDIEGVTPTSPSTRASKSVAGFSGGSGGVGKGRRVYSWLSKISTLNLELCGSDLSQRIELSCPNGPCFKTDLRKRRDESGVQDQKQFTVLNSSNEKLLTVDFSKDRKSFHIMEPDSNNFIAFFTVTGSMESSRVDIHNVIDDEIYHADPTDTPYRLVIKSEKGEEMGTITKPSPKWTQILSGTMTLNFTGDEREGLTTREKAIILGFLIALGIFGMDYWKRSSSGILTFYLISVLLFSALVIFIYCRFREGVVGYKPPKRDLPSGSFLFPSSAPINFNYSKSNGNG